MAEEKNTTLPKSVEIYLDGNLAFNKFGLVNIKVLKEQTKCELPDEELKELIQAKFGAEMRDGKVEFI